MYTYTFTHYPKVSKLLFLFCWREKIFFKRRRGGEVECAIIHSLYFHLFFFLFGCWRGWEAPWLMSLHVARTSWLNKKRGFQLVLENATLWGWIWRIVWQWCHVTKQNTTDITRMAPCKMEYNWHLKDGAITSEVRAPHSWGALT